MRSLILEYAETTKGQKVDYSIIEYSEKKNLCVIKDTEIEAILFKLANNNRNDVNLFLETETRTYTETETSDSDKDWNPVLNLLDTQTLTDTIETTDSDNQLPYQLDSIFDTMTRTNVFNEVSDSDK